MRATLATVLAVLGAALAANILGEYELTPVVTVVAGLVVGVCLGELFVGLGRWRGLLPAAVGAGLAVGALLWAGWLDSGEGLEPFPATAWLGAAIGAATAAVRTVRGPART